MMLEKHDNSTPLQRAARGVLVGMCVILAAGLLGAAGVNAVSAADPQPRWIDETQAEEMTEAQHATAVIESESLPVIGAAGAGATLAPAAAEPNRSRLIWMEVTAYCPCVACCGDDSPGITASGKPVTYNNGEFVAADTSLFPFGTKVMVPGYAEGKAVEVIDRGGAIKGYKLDLYFDSHQEARIWGRQWVAVTVLE